MISDQERLRGYVEAWRSAVDDVVTLLRSLEDDDWSRPTDLPGWDVKGIVCHLAHLESDLAGVKQKRVELPDLPHLTAPTSRFTELGIVARQEMEPAAIVDELEESARVRHEQLLADPPSDGKADPPRTPGRIGWNWETLLSNRVVDVWMHDQDIRRAVGRPGGFGSAGAAHTVEVFARSFPYVVGKLVAPPAGTTVALEVTGAHPVHLTLQVDETGRARPLSESVENPSVALRMPVEAFVLLAGGRRPVEELAGEAGVDVTGDEVLGRRILEAMAVTP